MKFETSFLIDGMISKYDCMGKNNKKLYIISALTNTPIFVVFKFLILQGVVIST